MLAKQFLPRRLTEQRARSTVTGFVKRTADKTRKLRARWKRNDFLVDFTDPEEMGRFLEMVLPQLQDWGVMPEVELDNVSMPTYHFVKHKRGGGFSGLVKPRFVGPDPVPGKKVVYELRLSFNPEDFA